MSKYEQDLHLNSNYKNHISANNCNCTVQFKGGVNLQNTEHVRLKAATIPNMFHNIYGSSRSLWYSVDAAPATELVLPSALYASPQDLADTLCAALLVAEGALLTCVATVSSSGIITFDYTWGTGETLRFLSMTESITISEAKCTLNTVLGVHHQTSVTSTTQQVMEDPIALNGVRKIYIQSSKLHFGRSIRSDGYPGSVMASLDFTGVPYGFTKHELFPDAQNYETWFTDHVDCNAIDIQILDEYGQILSLPYNQHIDLEFIIGAREIV